MTPITPQTHQFAARTHALHPDVRHLLKEKEIKHGINIIISENDRCQYLWLFHSDPESFAQTGLVTSKRLLTRS